MDITIDSNLTIGAWKKLDMWGIAVKLPAEHCCA